jgi:hypothetical protein
MKCIVNMACGLANRMFQYSYYLYLRQLGFDVQVDFCTSAKLSHEYVLWDKIFPNASFEQALYKDVFRLGGGSDICSKFCRSFLPFLTNVQIMPTAFDAQLPSGKKEEYIIGVFQNATMVESLGNAVKQSFVFSAMEGQYNLNLMKCFAKEESVAVHVRKGEDYLQRKWYKNTCLIEYYHKAVALMCENLNDPRFYVFTDNPEWVENNFTGFDYVQVEGNPIEGWGSHFDMQLMSCCKHNIISNSTYSWWAAFLNENHDKLVICPKIWFNPESCTEFVSDRLLCKDWITF